ncbi:MAG: T9SS type A sorting domain-containing protein [Bacteroidota bacterium]
MKRFLLFPVSFLYVAIFAIGQNVVQLNPPGNVGNQPDTKNTIYLGAIPSGGNSSPVLVFVHGYLGQGETWFETGDMYDFAYNAGHRTAFVQLGKKDNMWTNGQLLANMLIVITNHFGVNDVVLVAHSKGGVDSEAAMVHYGAHPKVSRLITLSTPFYGSQLADLAQSWWLSWISWPLGQKNDATYVLQTSYMNYFRSITDPHPNNPQVDARTYGAWGYAWGPLHIPGLYIAAAGGGNSTGGNDGVVAYNKSQRPGGLTVWPGYPANASKLDHFEIREGSQMWAEIQGQLNGLRVRSDARTPEAYNPNAVVHSHSQILASESGEQRFVIPPEAGEVWIEVRHEFQSDEIRITNPKGEELIAFHKKPSHDEFLRGFSTWFALPSGSEGSYAIDSESPFVAIVSETNGIVAHLSSDLDEKKLVYEPEEEIRLEVGLDNLPFGLSDRIEVTAVLQKTASLDGGAVEGASPLVLSFQPDGGHVFSTLIDEMLTPGIYNISLNVEHASFRRSIVSSLAINDEQAIIPHAETDIVPFTLFDNYPNPVQDQTQLVFELHASSNAHMRVYDMRGRMIWQKDLGGYPVGKHEITWQPATHHPSGLYVIEIQDGVHRVSSSMLLQR